MEFLRLLVSKETVLSLEIVELFFVVLPPPNKLLIFPKKPPPEETVRFYGDYTLGTGRSKILSVELVLPSFLNVSTLIMVPFLGGLSEFYFWIIVSIDSTDSMFIYIALASSAFTTFSPSSDDIINDLICL